VEAADGEDMSKPRASPTVPSARREEVAAAKGQGCGKLCGADAVDIDVSRRQQSIGETITKSRKGKGFARGLDEPAGGSDQQRRRGSTTDGDQGVNNVTGLRKSLRSDRPPYFETAASELRYPYMFVFRVKHADPSLPSPSAFGPTVCDHQPSADPHRVVRVHESGELVSVGGHV